MTSSSRLALALVLVGLAGCATTSPAEPPLRASLGAAPLEDQRETELDLSADRTAVGFFMAGATALNEGRASDAAKFFDRASELAPPEDQAFLSEQAFTAAVMAGDIERAARLAPTDKEASTYRLGRLVGAVDSLARGDGAAAYAVLTSEDFGAGYRPAAELVRPWAALAAKQTDAATSADVNPTAGGPQGFVALNQALVLEAAGKLDEAGELYASLANISEGVGLVTLAYGSYLERRGMRKEAVAVYDAALRGPTPDEAIAAARARAANRRAAPPPLPTAQEGAAQALMIAALVALDQRQSGAGIAFLRMTLRLDPRRTDATLLAGDFLAEAGDAQGARATFASIPPQSAEYLAAQARIVASYQKEDNDAAALEAARRLAQAAPRQPGPQILLADVLRDTKDYAGSAKVLDKVIAERGRAAEWNLYFARGISKHLAGDWPGAEKDLLHAYALAPEEPEVLNYLGYSWADRGERVEEALTLLKKAAAGAPNSGAIIDSLGWAYFRAGDDAKALENLERAVELAPAAADINDHLGDVYAKVGRTLEARYQWQRVLTLDADDELKAKVQAKLAATPEPPPIVAASISSPNAAP